MSHSLIITLRNGIRELPPAYFALVMATGIVSIAANLAGMRLIALAMLGFNIVAYITLLLLTLLRFVWYRAEFIRDLADHRKSVGFFATVAGTSVLGNQSIIVVGQYSPAIVLWVFGIVLWILSTYTIFGILVVKKHKPSLAEGITGAWLLAVVATQSICVLSALLASHWAQPLRLEVNFLALSMWLWGGMLYIWMISLIFYRYTFFTFQPGDLEAPYWINMGAMAISTLGGTALISNASDAWFLHSLQPFLEGFTVFFWATGTWWVPMLVILFVWRHAFRKFPFTYDPLYWGAVFPLGMYAVCTFEVSKTMGLGFLDFISETFVYIALVAWLFTFFGMMHKLGDSVRRSLTANHRQMPPVA